MVRVVFALELHRPSHSQTDGDRLADTREGSPPYDLIVGDQDSWDLANFVHPHYATYGDNEFLTRIAETAGLVTVLHDQDWSEGGMQWRR